MKIREKRRFLLSALAPLRGVLDKEKCAATLAAEFHANSRPPCPACGELPPENSKALLAGRRVLCRSCNKGFNLWTGTILEAAKVNPDEFILMRVALAVGLDHAGLVELTGRSSQCVGIWTKKIKGIDLGDNPPEVHR